MPDYMGKSISGRVITARKVDKSTAVSYTHLDVYKRQLYTVEIGFEVLYHPDAGTQPPPGYTPDEYQQFRCV